MQESLKYYRHLINIGIQERMRCMQNFPFPQEERDEPLDCFLIL